MATTSLIFPKSNGSFNYSMACNFKEYIHLKNKWCVQLEASQLWIAILNWCTHLTEHNQTSKCNRDHGTTKTITKKDTHVDFREIWQSTTSKPKFGHSPPPFLILEVCPLSTTHMRRTLNLRRWTFQAHDYACHEEEQHCNEVWNTPCISNIP
jgi:hypothetical protein